LTIESLLVLRQICEEDIQLEWFQNAKDREVLNATVAACKNKPLWRLLAACNTHIFGPLECYRRWGMVCSCPEHIQQRKEHKKVSCIRDGRRLDEAWPKVQEMAEAFKTRKRTLRTADVEDDVDLYPKIRRLCAQAAGHIKHRFKYYGILPWSLALCLTPAGAQDALTEWESVPPAEHDFYTQRCFERFEDAVRDVKDGGRPTASLHAEITAMKWATMDEGRGEGYHRSTNREKVRAASSTQAHLKQCTRMKACLQTCRAFVRMYKDRGRQVLRQEWHTFTRVLQVRREKRWMPKKLGGVAFWARLYREDAKSMEDWTSILRRMPQERPAAPNDAPEERDALRKEYLVHVLQPNTHYRVDHVDDTPAPDGSLRSQMLGSTHFHLLGLSYGSARPHTMHTIRTADDPCYSAYIALHVEWMRPGALDIDGGPPNANRCVLEADAESEWITLDRLPPFDCLARYLSSYAHVIGDVDRPGSVVVAEPHHVGVRVPLLDARCPTLCIVRELRVRLGWVPHSGLVVHTSDAPLIFDGREAVRMKFYYQCLLNVDRRLALTSDRLPSQQPQSYYKLLLRDVPAEPDLGDRVYTLALNETRRRGQPLLPLPPPEPPRRLGGDDDIIVAAPELPAAKPRARLPGAPRGRGGGRGAARPPLPPPVPPPPGLGPPGVPPVRAPGPFPGGPPPPPIGGGEAPPLVDEDDRVMVVAPPPPPKAARAARRVVPKFVAALLPDSEVRFDAYDLPKQPGRTYTNYVMKCPTCVVDCQKTAGTIMEADEEKQLKLLASLHVWLLQPWDQERYPRHNHVPAPMAATRAYVAEHRDALLEVMARAKAPQE